MSGPRGKLLLSGAVAAFGVVGALAWLSGSSSDRPSTCFGSTSRGALSDAWKLPRTGGNFRAYSDLGWLLGRTFLHSAVHQVVLESYRSLGTAHSEYRFVYGETGFESGGPLKPHRTHQNGLSVDFMVPVRDATGTVVELPTSVFRKFGYGLEFDDAGKQGELRIDFEAMALHLGELKRSAKGRGVRIARVIFDPKLRAHLTRTRAWQQIKDLPFMTTPPWIRHDEHYHVDFELPCRPLTDRA